ncbi:MAG: DUF6305 family protein [Longimicrobiales bacterium]|nr:DUF6305 family protein [Longimicrobiales bacterium]
MTSLRRVVCGLAAASLALAGALPVVAQAQAPTAQLPILLTSCGQSPGPERVKFFFNRLQLQHEFLPQATAQDLVAARDAGRPYKTLMIVTGASLKGMGAAGVAMPQELARTASLIDEAKRQGITLIGAHVEGMARRAQGAAPGDNSDEQSIDAVMPKSAFMIVRKDGDEDGRFTRLSGGGRIPLLLFEKNMELGDLLTRVFGS